MRIFYAKFCISNEIDTGGVQDSLPAPNAGAASNKEKDAYTVPGHLHLLYLLLRVPR